MVFGFCSFPLTLHTQFSFLKICFKNLVIIVVQVCWDFLFHPSCSFFFHLLSFNSIIYLKQMCPMWLLSCTQISKWLASAWKLFYSFKSSFFTRFSFKYLPFFSTVWYFDTIIKFNYSRYIPHSYTCCSCSHVYDCCRNCIVLHLL